MKLIVFGCCTFVAITSRLFGKRMRKCIAGTLILICFLLGIFYNFRNLEQVNPMTRIKTQTIYQEEHYENLQYPDSFLRTLLREREVKIPYEIKPVEEYMTPTWEKEGGEFFNSQYYKETNYGRFLQAYAKTCVVDEELPDMEETDALVSSFADFTCIGKSNDMLRYTFLLNEDGVQESAYFWYSWYYYSYFVDEKAEGKFSIYVRTDDMKEADSYIALWDKKQNLYLMSAEYYESEVKGNG